LLLIADDAANWQLADGGGSLLTLSLSSQWRRGDPHRRRARSLESLYACLGGFPLLQREERARVRRVPRLYAP
jgi:hypothetical protein